jgi:hypothetical protein
MKKIAYALLLLFALAGTFSACTDENVAPTTQQAGGGGGIDPK